MHIDTNKCTHIYTTAHTRICTDTCACMQIHTGLCTECTHAQAHVCTYTCVPGSLCSSGDSGWWGLVTSFVQAQSHIPNLSSSPTLAEVASFLIPETQGEAVPVPHLSLGPHIRANTSCSAHGLWGASPVLPSEVTVSVQ